MEKPRRNRRLNNFFNGGPEPSAPAEAPESPSPAPEAAGKPEPGGVPDGVLPVSPHTAEAVPDILSGDAVRKELPGPRDGELIYLPSVDSTNLELSRRAGEGAPAGSAVIADAQTAGRGRLGRSFYSPAGAGLYLSYLIRSQEIDRLSLLTSCSGLAVCRALSMHGVEAMIKWPNDLILGGRKLCGILTSVTSDDGGRSVFAVVGIGINVLGRSGDFPPDLRGRVVTLAEWGAHISRARLAAEIISGLDEMFLTGRAITGDTSEYLAELRRRSCTIGRWVRVKDPAGEWSGQAVDIDSNGALLIKRTDGEMRLVSSGEVSVRGLTGYM